MFFAIKVDDFDHAAFLLRLSAPVNTSYFIEQDRLAYTTSIPFFIFRPAGGKGCTDVEEVWSFACEVKTAFGNSGYLH